MKIGAKQLIISFRMRGGAEQEILMGYRSRVSGRYRISAHVPVHPYYYIFTHNMICSLKGIHSISSVIDGLRH